MLSAGSDSSCQFSLSRFSRVNHALPTQAIHSSRRSAVVIQQPHAAGVALALFDERLGEDAEEAGDVGLAHEQIERGLDRVALDVGHALGAAAIVGLARQARFSASNLGLWARAPGRARSRRCEWRVRRFWQARPSRRKAPPRRAPNDAGDAEVAGDSDDAGAFCLPTSSIMRQVAAGLTPARALLPSRPKVTAKLGRKS